MLSGAVATLTTTHYLTNSLAFILIMSSGNSGIGLYMEGTEIMLSRKDVLKYWLDRWWFAFLACQAWEWTHLITWQEHPILSVASWMYCGQTVRCLNRCEDVHGPVIADINSPWWIIKKAGPHIHHHDRTLSNWQHYPMQPVTYYDQYQWTAWKQVSLLSGFFYHGIHGTWLSCIFSGVIINIIMFMLG